MLTTMSLPPLFWVWVALAVLLIVSWPFISRRLDRHDLRRNWQRWASAHEVGHALVAWFGCPTTLTVEWIGLGVNCFVCHCATKKSRMNVPELWHWLAFCLGGMAGETTLLGRLNRPRNCRPDFDLALKAVNLMIGTGQPLIEQARSIVSSSEAPLPDWTRISPKSRLSPAQAEILNLGFRLATVVIAQHREAFDRARALALPRYDQVVMLTKDEIVACFSEV